MEMTETARFTLSFINLKNSKKTTDDVLMCSFSQSVLFCSIKCYIRVKEANNCFCLSNNPKPKIFRFFNYIKSQKQKIFTSEEIETKFGLFS